MKTLTDFLTLSDHIIDCQMKRLFLIAVLSVLTLPALVAKNKYVYTQIGQKEGLTSTVNCIYKEKDGDVWIGTPVGLFSFDGYTLKNHTDKLLKSRKVFDVSKDNDGNLWVLTEKHILVKKDGSDHFTQISHVPKPHFSLLHEEDCTWIGSKGEIFRYAGGQLESFCPMREAFDCRSIGKIDGHTLLCCSPNGKFLIDTERRTVSDAPFGDINEVSAMLVDSKGHIWIAYYNKGIEVYEKDGTILRKYTKDNSALSNDIVLCLEERGSMILAGTDGGGINIIDPGSDTIRTMSHISGDKYSFPAHSIKSLYTDHYGNLWAGSIRDGLISVTVSEISSYSDTFLGFSNGLSNPTVLCLHQDSLSDYVWIGTDGEGINRFDPNTSDFTHYSSTFKKKVVSLADYSPDKLAISIYGDGLYLFSKTSGTLSRMPLESKDLTYQLKYSGRSVNLYNEQDGDLLMFSNSVYRYDVRSGTCRQLDFDPAGKTRSNFLVIGRSDEGVWLHNKSNIYLLSDNADSLIFKGSHAHGEISSGHLSADGTIWLATGEGLCLFNTADATFSHITTTIFSDATSVMCDRNSRVWIGTEKGLSVYLSESGSFALLGKSDGADPNEFLPKPRLLTGQGDVYLGGVQGLLRIGNGYIIDADEEPELHLRDMEIDGERVSLKENRRIVMPRNSKSMRIDVEVREKDMFRHRVYRFDISGKIYETSLPELTLQQLPGAGLHTISVSCTRRNGEWMTPVSLCAFRIPQPWYLSWWFIVGCVVLLTGIYVTAIYSIHRRKEGELKIAMQQQEQKVYEEKVQMLINVSHELRTPLTLIMAPLKRLLKDSDAEREDFQVLSRIYRQSRRMRSLLDMVLDLRKMEVGGNRLKKETVDFNAWIAGSVDDIVNEEKAEGINVVYDFDSAVGSADIDIQKCDIILMNILINAIKHSTVGDTVTIRTSLSSEGMIRTSISDQGPGLGADIDMSKMFTRFYQSNSEKYGSGIGLSYSKILVELHGGNIGVYNNPDKGATFWWEIPACGEAAVTDSEPRAYLNELLGHSSEADISLPAGADFSTSGMRLMIVDDNQDLLDFLREALCQDFAEVITVTGGNPALKELSAGRLPDIIVSDVNMPDGDGFKLCSEIKKNEKFSHIPVILLTARGEDQSQSESYRLGADGFLAKPFEIETLMELVRGQLRGKAEIRKRYLDEDSVAEADYGSNEERFILQLNKIISEHMSDPGLDQQLICMELGVSRALLYNKMKAITGAGAKEYITKIRIEKAKSLIESTSLTIAEISDMTGFASQSYFSTAFKNYTGMTPSQYKAANRKKD